MLNYINWNVNPEIFSIGPLSIRWYGLLLALGFYCAYRTILYAFKKEGISQDFLDKFAITLIIWTVIGLRLGHVFFYEPEYYLSNPIKILKVWEGGLASHGAIITMVIYIIYFTRKNKVPILWLFDRVCFSIPIVGTLVRIGNLMNSEIYGDVTTMPWGFIFQRIDNVPRHPSQIYESLAYLSLFIFLIWYYKKLQGKIPAGRFFGIMMIWVFTARFIIEFFKEVQVDFEQTMLLDMGQILSIPAIITGIILVIYSYKHKKIPIYIEPQKENKTQKETEK